MRIHFSFITFLLYVLFLSFKSVNGGGDLFCEFGNSDPIRCAEIKCPKGKEPIACTATNTGNDCQACPTGTFADTETFRKRREDVFGNCEMKTCQTMRSCTGDDIEVLQYGNATENTKCKCTTANFIVAVCTSIAVFIILIVLGLYGYYRVKRRDNNRRDDGM
ncbi:DgyrCDS10776 [Dimorphilus gyrociliatus]|uniref:DgyrCDS10776 n=1 Tax=Dimorphilus gyrociliatus TaxID=2664684 RepID=A0A7I8W198_9ANNE|nr:DgyrCDS10776 [Dimorphilus gyrociliatus]